MTTATLHELAADWSWKDTSDGFRLSPGGVVWEEAEYVGDRLRIGRVIPYGAGLKVVTRYPDPETVVTLEASSPSDRPVRDRAVVHRDGRGCTFKTAAGYTAYRLQRVRRLPYTGGVVLDVRERHQRHGSSRTVRLPLWRWIGLLEEAELLVRA